MSQNYAAGLSDYANKGVLGLPEVYDSDKALTEKVLTLANLIREAKHIVVHTGAGISTAAGNFRGPRGIWTAEKKKVAPAPSKPFHEAIPTYTHMAIQKLVSSGVVNFVVSQNIDGLHVRSGLSMDHLAELHGNVFMEECRHCRARLLRNATAATIGRKATGGFCLGTRKRGYPCRGSLIDTVLDWCHALPEPDFATSVAHSSAADLNIVLGSTMQISPSGDLPMSAKLRDPHAKFVICNLQRTKFDGKADLTIHAKVDDIFRALMSHLEIDVPKYQASADPVLNQSPERTLLTRNILQITCTALVLPKKSVSKKRPKEESDEETGLPAPKIPRKLAPCPAHPAVAGGCVLETKTKNLHQIRGLNWGQ